MLGTAAMMVWCGLTSVGVGVSDIEKRCNAHRLSGNAFCIFGVGRYTCIFGSSDGKNSEFSTVTSCRGILVAE